MAEGIHQGNIANRSGEISLAGGFRRKEER